MASPHPYPRGSWKPKRLSVFRRSLIRQPHYSTQPNCISTAAAFKELMRSGLDCKKHPKPPNMAWQLEQVLQKEIKTIDEVKLLTKMTDEPNMRADYAGICAGEHLVQGIIDSPIRAFLRM